MTVAALTASPPVDYGSMAARAHNTAAGSYDDAAEFYKLGNAPMATKAENNGDESAAIAAIDKSEAIAGTEPGNVSKFKSDLHADASNLRKDAGHAATWGEKQADLKQAKYENTLASSNNPASLASSPKKLIEASGHAETSASHHSSGQQGSDVERIIDRLEARMGQMGDDRIQ